MGGYRIQRAFVPVAVLGLALGAPGCLSSSSVDLAYNSYIYVSPGYEAPRRVDAQVFVQGVKDERKAPDFSNRDSVKRQFSDGVWERPLPVMVEEVLVDEIDRSCIYDGISTGSGGVPRNGDFVVQPFLHGLYRYREAMTVGEHFGKRRSGAYGALRLRVLSPMNATGKREILLDEVFQDLVVTDLGRSRPQEGIVLAGRALQNIMRKAMPKLYESNIRAVPGAPVRK